MYTLKTFNDVAALQDYLNGAVLGLPLPATVSGLHNTTLIIEVGSSAITVTFSDPSGLGLTPSAILAAIREEDASMSEVYLRNYGYTNPKNPQLAVAGIGYKLLGQGTANAILGFSTDDIEISEIADQDIVSFTVNPAGPLYCVLTHS